MPILASQNISHSRSVVYCDLETVKLVKQDPKKYSKDENEKIVCNMPSVFVKEE